jgi:hypothetical protein
LIAGAAIGLPLALFIWFYPFIRNTFERASPSGLIDFFLTDFDAAEYIENATLPEEGQLRDHPFHPVFRLARSAVNNQEIDLAGGGVEAIRDGVFALLEAAKESNRVFEDDDGELEFYGMLFAGPIISYLPNLAYAMSEEGYTNAAANAFEALREVSVKALEEDIIVAYESGVGRFVHYITVLDMEEGVYPAVVSEYLSLFASTAPRHPEKFISINETTAWQVFEDVFGGLAEDERRDNQYVQMFFKAYATAQGAMLDTYAETYVGLTDEDVMGQSVEERWTYEEMMTELVNGFFDQVFEWDGKAEADEPVVAALVNWRLGLQWVTMSYFQTVDWPAEPGLRPFEVVVKPWKRIVIDSLNGGCDAHGRLVLRRFTELLIYIQTESEKGQYLVNLSVHLADVVEEADAADVAAEVFDVILDEPNRVDIDYRTFGGMPRSMGWSPLSMGDYAEEELDAARELKEVYEERMDRRTEA